MSRDAVEKKKDLKDYKSISQNVKTQQQEMPKEVRRSISISAGQQHKTQHSDRDHKDKSQKNKHSRTYNKSKIKLEKRDNTKSKEPDQTKASSKFRTAV